MSEFKLEDDGFSDSLLKSSEKYLHEYRWQVLTGLVGLLLVGGGIFVLGSGFFEQPKVEVLGSSIGEIGGIREIGGKIIVEISGEVEKPGVYELEKDKRIEDLLISSGGLTFKSDKTWVEKNLNRAQKLVDGQKVYIPRLGEIREIREIGGIKTTENVESKININSASLKELDSLSGIGEVRAQAIIDNRPYGTIEELVSKKVVPKSVFEKIKESIIAQ